MGFLANASMESRQFFDEAASLPSSHEGLFLRRREERVKIVTLGIPRGEDHVSECGA